MLNNPFEDQMSQPADNLLLKDCSTMEQLKKLKVAGILRALDFYFAKRLYQLHPTPLSALAAALVSFETALGNSCLYPDKFMKTNTLFNLPKALHNYLLESVSIAPAQWLKSLQNSPVVSDGTICTPLVFEGKRLYLHRYWYCETFILHWLYKHSRRDLSVNTERCKVILNRLFPDTEKEINWQKIAVALAVSSSFSVISGGPGTGKTTTVTRLMALFTELSIEEKGTPLTIRLVAPTGKAAARLSESVRQASDTLNCTPTVKQYIPKQASTLHRLLGTRPGKTTYRYNEDNPLHLDLLIVDESSMIDLSLMASLLAALPDNARLVLLGDKDQLSPVETGNVFSDICQFSSRHYTSARLTQLQQLTGDTHLQSIPCQQDTNMKGNEKIVPEDHICLLRKSYRFKEDSGIGHLAQVINKGTVKELDSLWERSFADIILHEEGEILESLLSLAIASYSPYLQAIKQQKPVPAIHQAFSEFQLLCVLHEGKFGVREINAQVQHMLIQKELLPATHHFWYPGRPVMITCNDYALSLYNGDIGITVRDHDGKLRVAFITPEGNTKLIMPSRLPEHETVFAMTVHKSQGSEFTHTALVLPDKYVPLLTRELLYTGITRARKKLDLFGHTELIKLAIKRKVARSSGIVERIINDNRLTQRN